MAKADENYVERLCNSVAKKMVEVIENITIEDVNMYQIGYNKAIDDFYDKALNFEDYIEPINEDNGVLVYSGKDITNMIVTIAKEMKGGTL